jgi:long-subunit acyl-CoA synthetase (AMP-forming)
VGELDPDGFLRITDRKKDLLITSGGKNVAPQVIEQKLCEIPLISQAVVIGDGRKYLSALLTLKPEELDRICARHQIPEEDPARRARHPAVRAELERAIQDSVNPRLARYETIKRFEVLPAELTESAGELTPTMKVKRKVVAQRYAEQIRGLYAEDIDAG